MPRQIELTEFSLNDLAANGLRRGRTTGSCATAAVKAALYLMLCSEYRNLVSVTLPYNHHYLVIPIQAVRWLDEHSVRAEVIKDGCVDPDNTHGAIIFAIVRKKPARPDSFFCRNRRRYGDTTGAKSRCR